MSQPPAAASRPAYLSPAVLLGAGVGLVLLWVFWPTLVNLVARWARETQYTHGFLVAPFALFLLWWRRDRLAGIQLRPSWWGVPLLGSGLGLRFLGTFIYQDTVMEIALLPCLAGVSVLLGGWRSLLWTWPAIAYLVFMIPLPHSVGPLLSNPLQRIATVASTYALQTLGIAAFAEGTVIRMGEIRIGVVEACSGLSMLTTFVALAVAVVILVPRPWLDKGVILLSAIPIAVVVNIIRITVTGVLHKTVGTELADLVFHGLAGYLMPILALLFLWLEFGMLRWVFPPVAPEEMPPTPVQMQPVSMEPVSGPMAPPERREYLKPMPSTAPKIKKKLRK